jgi:hypothetical protein
VLALPALWHIAVLAWLFAKRWDYPADIEWLEGNLLYEAHRLRSGQTVFGPAAVYMPNLYTPGHAATLALLGCVFRLDYPLGRLLSIASFSVGCGVLARVVWRHWEGFRCRLLPALLAVAFACAAYPVIGQWYDLVRVDSLAMGAILVAAFVASEGTPSTGRLIATVVLLVYAVYVKQTNAFFALWIIAFTYWRDRRRGISLALATGALGAAILLALVAETGGWFWYWCFELPARQPRDYGHAVDALKRVIRFSPLIGAPVLLFPWLLWRRSLSNRASFWFGMAIAALPAALSPITKVGGSDNNFVPLLFPLGAIFLIVARDLGKDKALIGWAVCATGSAYLLWQTYDFRRYPPTDVQRAEAEAMNAEIAALDGSVVVPGSPFLPIRNGKECQQFTQMSYVDTSWATLPVDFDRFLRESGARWVILNSTSPDTSIERLVVARYAYQGELPVFVPAWATTPTGPKDVYRKRGD